MLFKHHKVPVKSNVKTCIFFHLGLPPVPGGSRERCLLVEKNKLIDALVN